LSHLTRAQLLSAAGNLVVSADADLAKVAATAELLAVDFYKRAIASGHFTGDEREYLAAARDNEIEHYGLLKVALGKATPHGLRLKFPNGVSPPGAASQPSARRSRLPFSAPISARSGRSRATR
jgi:hypothetical protein